MPLKMMYITNNPEVAKVAEKNTVDRIWVDLEKIGKDKRQGGMNTVQSTHVLSDVSVIRDAISSAELLVRVNPIYEESKEEIREVINRGADIIMLPFFKTRDEVARFLEYVNSVNISDKKVKTLLLLETIEAEHNIEAILDEFKGAVDEVHIGLNDLHLQYGSKFMFELLANGKVDEIVNVLKKYQVSYGFGGIARLDEGLVPARHVIPEHYRLGSSMAILSRSFYDSWISDDLEEIERVFKYGMSEIRDYENRLSHEVPEFFERNRQKLIDEVNAVVRNK